MITLLILGLSGVVYFSVNWCFCTCGEWRELLPESHCSDWH